MKVILNLTMTVSLNQPGSFGTKPNWTATVLQRLATWQQRFGTSTVSGTLW